MGDVKARPGEAQRERAKATRSRIVGCAYELFSEQGYSATTMAAVAEAAGVAIQTVYYIFRTKGQLFREVFEAAAAGEDAPPPVMARAWMTKAFEETDPRRSIALVVEHGVDIYARVAPLSAAAQEAGSLDEEIRDYLRGVVFGRKAGMRTFVEHLSHRGQLRTGLTAERGTDITFVLHSHETFLGLTREAGWQTADFKQWLYRTLCAQLLDDAPTASGLPTAGLSFHEAL